MSLSGIRNEVVGLLIRAGIRKEDAWCSIRVSEISLVVSFSGAEFDNDVVSQQQIGRVFESFDRAPTPFNRSMTCLIGSLMR